MLNFNSYCVQAPSFFILFILGEQTSHNSHSLAYKFFFFFLKRGNYLKEKVRENRLKIYFKKITYLCIFCSISIEVKMKFWLLSIS